MNRTQLFAAALLTLASTSLFAGLERGIKGHASGEVIAVQTDEQTAAWCDFSKQIVVTSTNVLCVYNGKKDTGNDISL